MVNKGVIIIGSLALGGGLIFALTRTASASTGEWCCPYCDLCFETYEALVEHVQSVHPGERIPLPIEWE